MPITYQISTEKNQFYFSLTITHRENGKEKLDFLPPDYWWVIGFTYTRRTKSINKIDIFQFGQLGALRILKDQKIKISDNVVKSI